MTGNRQRYQDAMRIGSQYAWDNDWRMAIEQFEIARLEFPEDATPYSHLGQAHFRMSNYDKALGYYQQAARLEPSDMVALGRIADILERMGQLNQAARTYMAVAESFLKRRELDPAVENWQRATRLDPDLVGARQRLALIYYRRGRLQDSIREHLALARIHQSRGDVRQAAIVCKAALDLEPGNVEVLRAVDLLRRGVMVGDPDGELTDKGQTIASKKSLLAQALRTAVNVLEGDSRVTSDQEATGKGSPVEDARQIALANLADSVFEEGAENALGQLEKTDRDSLISRAIASQTRGDVDDAIDAYERAISGGIRLPAVHFNLGLLYQERMRLDEAIDQLERSLNDSEYLLGSHLALGECFRAKGRLDEALSHFLQVSKIVDLRSVNREQADDMVRLYDRLATTYAVKGEQERALDFANALVQFLNTRGWEDKVREARARLDALGEGGQAMSLAEILTVPGSDQLLESISMTMEYSRRGWMDTAVEECYRAIQLAPFFLPAHLYLARLLEQRGQIEAAENKFVTVAEAYRVKGETRHALNAYENAIALAPLDMTLRTRMIEILKRHGEIDRALEHSIALAESYYQLAQLSKSREKYEEALQLAPRGSPDLHWQLKILHRMADIDMQRLNWKSAVSAYHQIVRISAEDERANIALVELLFKLGKSHEATNELDRFLARLASQGKIGKVLSILQDLLAQEPDNMGLLHRLAAAYSQAGEKEKAIEHLDRLGELQLDAGLRVEAANTIRMILALEPADEEGYRQLFMHISGSM